MLFNSYVFLLAFLPVTWAGFYLAGRIGQQASVAWLVLASLFFYAWWDAAAHEGGPFFGARYLLLLAGSIGLNFALGRALMSPRTGERARRALLAAGIAANLGALAWFKYTAFGAATLNALAGTDLPVVRIALPIGVSFYTFVQIAYLVDARRGRAGRYSLLNYSLFVTFFPHLMAGPIVHHDEMLPQFERGPDRPLSENAAVGLTMLAFGLFKKVMIADMIAPTADAVFKAAGAGEAVNAAQAWTGALSYTFQLYFDFSGYSDMALGVSLLFGVRFPQNFNSPYKALDIIDFWRRWHITLSRFLRDYLYIPLGGGHAGKARRYLNLMLTMLLGGLWHGAAWPFVAWGGLHGAYLVVNHAWRAATARWHPGGAPGSRRRGAWNLGVARPLTFLAVVVGWVFFRTGSFGFGRRGFDAAWLMLRAMAGAGGRGMASGHPEGPTATTWIVALVALCWLMPNTQQVLGLYRPALDSHVRAEPFAAGARVPAWLRWRPRWYWALLVGALLLAVIPNLERVAQFLYWQF